MTGESPDAQDLARRMAVQYLAALGYAAAPGDALAEPLARMFLPAAQAVTETQAMAEELSARLDAYAGALAEVLLRDAEDRGDLDAMAWPDVELSDGYLRALDWDSLLETVPPADGPGAEGGA
jgi:hypothetical protein